VADYEDVTFGVIFYISSSPTRHNWRYLKLKRELGEIRKRKIAENAHPRLIKSLFQEGISISGITLNY